MGDEWMWVGEKEVGKREEDGYGWVKNIDVDS